MARWIRSRSSALLLLLSAVALADPAEDQARALFKQAQTAYEVGEFQRALDGYTEAYKAKALPAFLFNIAQCHRQMQNFERAAFFYGRYLDAADHRAPNLELARSLQDEMAAKQKAKEEAEAKAALEAKQAEEAKAAEEQRRSDELKHAADAPLAATPVFITEPPPMPPLEVAVVEKPVYRKWWFWTAIGAGAAAIAAGVTVAVVATRPAPMPVMGTLKDIP